MGSGFGGAVTACRLAEKGAKVLILERGRRWEPRDYPRDLNDAWIYDPNEPHKRNGWLDFRFFNDMAVAMGAGVGGGSLIYANVSIEAKPWLFDKGWPQEITYEELIPYYNKAGKTLNVQTVPDHQLSRRSQLMKEGAENLGYGGRFRKLPLAVTFSDKWSPDLEDPYNDKHSEPHRPNAQGQMQGTCVHCGNCPIGCQVRAKNTLDLNYIPWAEKHGAEVRPLHLVRYIEPENGGYRVYFDRIVDGQLIPGSESATRVIVAAGSLGSTELLLRCRDQYKSLPNLSRFLGRNWSSNGDFLTPATYDNRKVSPTQGVTISCAIDFLNEDENTPQFFIEDGGAPNALRNYLKSAPPGGPQIPLARAALKTLVELMGSEDPFDNVMPWFAQGVDAADGRLYLGRPWYAFWRKKRLQMDWKIERSKPVITAIINMHKLLSAATGGRPQVPLFWTAFKNLVTPHPLGGCNMGVDATSGVVDHRGEVFGYPNLFVADGAIIPEAIGLNPSRTIAALAERIAALITR
ncbi:MAG TPA: GMC family oxidoreductase [Blastocatellia bacterium]|nr:GMC family oxidoreductase [Blastocatellia bacterium]